LVNAKLALGFGLYWAICFLFYMMAMPYINAHYVASIGANISLASTPSNTTFINIDFTPGFIGGLWALIKEAFSALGFVFFGLGLPSGTPLFIQLIISTWQFIVLIMGIVLVLGVIPGED
jgi:hypothetical protein